MQEQLPRTFAQERTGMYSQRVSGAIPNCRRIHTAIHGLILRFNPNNPDTCANKHQGAGNLLQEHAVNPSMGALGSGVLLRSTESIPGLVPRTSCSRRFLKKDTHPLLPGGAGLVGLKSEKSRRERRSYSN